jgi:hypothetical protein
LRAEDSWYTLRWRPTEEDSEVLPYPMDEASYNNKKKKAKGKKQRRRERKQAKEE